MKNTIEKNSKNNIIKKILLLLDDIIYYIILIPLSIVAILVVYQSIRYPDKIPDIFGYKLFMVLDPYMDDSAKFGDLAITKNVNPNDIEVNNVIAFRNETNTVTMHRVLKITEEYDEDYQEKGLFFTMDISKNESTDAKYISEKKLEGKLKYSIPKIGLILMIIQEPLVTAIIIIFILIIGLIIYYIAQQLDMRDMRLMELEKKEEQEKSEITTDNEKEKVIK